MKMLCCWILHVNSLIITSLCIWQCLYFHSHSHSLGNVQKLRNANGEGGYPETCVIHACQGREGMWSALLHLKYSNAVNSFSPNFLTDFMNISPFNSDVDKLWQHYSSLLRLWSTELNLDCCSFHGTTGWMMNFTWNKWPSISHYLFLISSREISLKQ